MKKPPKFIIGNNPMVKESGTYITHMREPVFYAEVFEHENKLQQKLMHDGLITFQEKTGTSMAIGRDKNFHQPFTLLATNFPATTQEEADDIAKIMRRMADWYQAYLKWEESYDINTGN